MSSLLAVLTAGQIAALSRSYPAVAIAPERLLEALALVPDPRDPKTCRATDSGSRAVRPPLLRCRGASALAAGWSLMRAGFARVLGGVFG